MPQSKGKQFKLGHYPRFGSDSFSRNDESRSLIQQSGQFFQAPHVVGQSRFHGRCHP